MSISYFLGANSKDGFFSLYSNFAANPGDKLHIIKSGPGTGKSGFMRSIGEAAEAQGYDVRYVLCSGDPASLDGVYIPCLHQAWVDGTAPHVIEPRYFGIDIDYVNLGSFCCKDFTNAECEYAEHLYKAYQSCYTQAYGYLKLAGDIDNAFYTGCLGSNEENKVRKKVSGILSKIKTEQNDCCSFGNRCFLSSISCQGQLRLGSVVSELCKLVYSFDNRAHTAHFALSIVVDEAKKQNMETLVCLSPLSPTIPEAVLLPQYSLGFVSGDWGIESQKNLCADCFSPPPSSSAIRKERRMGEHTKEDILSLAVSHLKEAKALHDNLESVYISHMDFSALTEFTEYEKRKLFR